MSSSNSEIISSIISADKELFIKDLGGIISSHMRDITDVLKKSLEKNLDDSIKKFYDCDFKDLENKVFDTKLNLDNFKQILGIGNIHDYERREKINSTLKEPEIKYFYGFHSSGCSNGSEQYIFTKKYLYVVHSSSYRDFRYMLEHNLPLNILYIIKFSLKYDFNGFLEFIKEYPSLIRSNSIEFEKICVEEYKTICDIKEKLQKEREEFELEKAKYKQEIEQLKFKNIDKNFDLDKHIELREQLMIQNEECQEKLKLIRKSLDNIKDYLNTKNKIEEGRQKLTRKARANMGQPF